MARLRWLHLTDLHFGLDGGRRYWPSVKRKFLEDLGRVSARSGTWDLVFFTGDLAQRGAAEEYEELEQELDWLWEQLRALGANPVFCPIPGNHDLERPKRLPEVVALQQWNKDETLRREFWREPRCAYRGLIENVFAPYTAFVERFYRAHPLPEGAKMQRGILPGEYSLQLEQNGLRVGVVGLNSAFLQLEGGDYLGRLELDHEQLVGVCGRDPMDWLGEHDFSLLLTHHPSSWLSPRALEDFKAIIAPPGSFSAHLCGHLHDAREQHSLIGGAEMVRVSQAPSLLGLETIGDGSVKRAHGYSAGGVDLEETRGEYHLWPRQMQLRQSGAWAFSPHTSFELVEERLSESFVPRRTPGRPLSSRPAPPANAPGEEALPISEFKAITVALESAFPSVSSLERMVLFGLEQQLHTIANGDLRVLTYGLVKWAAAKDQIDRLLRAARKENPDNVPLREVAVARGLEAVPATSAPGASSTQATRPPQVRTFEVTPGVGPSSTAPTAPVPVVSLTPTSDPLVLKSRLREFLVKLFPQPADALRVSADAGLDRARINFQGAAENFWFNVLEEADNAGKLPDVLVVARKAYPQRQELAELQKAFAAPEASAPREWSEADLSRSLARLDPRRFEQVVFALRVERHLSPSGAPREVRDDQLLRVCKHQGRLKELGDVIQRVSAS